MAMLHLGSPIRTVTDSPGGRSEMSPESCLFPITTVTDSPGDVSELGLYETAEAASAVSLQSQQ
jgi:hypothetical protein